MAPFFALTLGSALIALSAAYPTLRLPASRLTPWWLVVLVAGWIAVGAPAVAWGGTAREVASWAAPFLGVWCFVGARITVRRRLSVVATAAAVEGHEPTAAVDLDALMALYADAKIRVERAMERDPKIRAKVEEIRRSYPPAAHA